MREAAAGEPYVGNREPQIRGGEAGASLVEILVAGAIIASALVVFVAALSTGLFAVRTSGQLTAATNLAASELETVKQASYPISGYSRTLQGYTVTLSCNELVADLQQVTVTVSYQGGEVTVSNYKVNR